MSGVALDGVTKRYDGVTAVDDLTLEVADGELLVLLGPSGCGKTTVLRMIAGLEEVSAGEVRIGGRAVTDVAPKDRDVAMVFQSYALYPHMTVAKNIESPLLARKMRPDPSESSEPSTPSEPPRRLRADERRIRVEQVAASLGLSELLGRKPAQLSGGQRQRVALARAMVARPAAFLMDEPLSNLDAQLRVQTRLELVELHQRLGATFVYVTHDQVEAMTMADRIAVMADGRLQQVGPPQEVYDAPRNLFVADFLGSPPMNTLPGSIHTSASGPTVRVGGQEVPIGAAVAEPPLEGTDVIVGIRPEHVVVDPEGCIDAHVTAVESLGHERLLVCDLGGRRIIVRQPSAAPGVAAGTGVALRVEPDRVHLFDPGTTERLP